MKSNILGLNISYNIEGSGDLIVFLHGWGCNKEIFKQSIDVCKTKYKTLSIDLPGFGESEEPKHGFCVDDYVDIVEKLIEEILEKDNSKNVILVGHSYGSRIIIKLNNRKTNFNIIKNVIIGGAGIKSKMTLKKYIKQTSYKLGKKIYSVHFFQKLFNKTLDEYKNEHGSLDYKNAIEVMRETLVKSVNEDLTKYLKNIKASTLLIWGDKDTETPLYQAKIMEENIGDSGLVILKDCTHFCFLEDTRTYISVLKSFLEI